MMVLFQDLTVYTSAEISAPAGKQHDFASNSLDILASPSFKDSY